MRNRQSRLRRRDFLRLSLLSLGTLLGPQVGRAQPSEATQRVVVVGAGASGLAAASVLHALGYAVTVLEARNRRGGRIWTNRDLGVPVDLGGSWIEDIEVNPITELIQNAGIVTRESDYDSVALYDADGRRLPDDELDDLSEQHDTLSDGLEEISLSRESDESIGAGLRELGWGASSDASAARLMAWIRSDLELNQAVDLDRVSLLNPASYAGDSDHRVDHVIPGGYDQLLDLLAAGLDVRLSQQVTEVTWGAGGVALQCASGEVFTADRAIVTIPLGVLQSGDVRFSPALPPEKLTAIHRLQMGALHKVALRFPTQFWPDREFLGYASGTPGEFPVLHNWAVHVGQPILVAMFSGTFGESLDGLPEREVVDRLMGVLRTMFGSAIAEPEASLVARWHNDPLARGSYSYYPVGVEEIEAERLAEPLDDVVFFAGEATYPERYGTVPGAYLSGLRAAELLMDR